MLTMLAILSGTNHQIDLWIRLLHVGIPLNRVSLIGLFIGQLLFVLKFLAGVMLVFIIGGLLGKIFHLENAYKSEAHSDHNLHDNHEKN